MEHIITSILEIYRVIFLIVFIFAQFFYYFYMCAFYPPFSGDSKGFIVRRIIQAFPKFNISIFYGKKLRYDLSYIKYQEARINLPFTVMTKKTFLFPLWWHTDAAISHYYLLCLNWVPKYTVVASTHSTFKIILYIFKGWVSCSKR